MTRHIGVMGGMFDPVHEGHLQVARFACQELGLHELRMIPCHHPGHRTPAIGSSSQRLAMLQLAIADMPGVLADDREIRRGGTSYMVDTLESLRLEFAGAQLVLIIGMDAFLGLPRWHRFEQLFDLCHLAVFARPGYVVDARSTCGEWLMKRQVTSVAELYQSTHGAIIVIDALKSPVSSTVLRRDIAAGVDIHDRVPVVVADYLVSHGLYGVSEI